MRHAHLAFQHDPLLDAVPVAPPSLTDRNLQEEDCRLLIVRGSAAESSPPSPAASPVKDAGTAYDDDEAGGIGEIAAFVHFRYEIEEEALLLYIYELQVLRPFAPPHCFLILNAASR